MSARNGGPNVLFVVDRPEWAHDRKTDALARELGSSYVVVKRFHADVTADDLERADCVLLYYWLQVERLAPLRNALLLIQDRLAIGICSHFELQGAWRGPGLAMLNELPCAIFANNTSLISEFKAEIRRPLHYTPNGVDTHFFRPAMRHEPATPDTLRVGWAGSLTNQGPEHRGVNEFIIPAIAAAGAEARFAIREEKWRNRDEMLEFYRSIDVYVCASRSEGTPNGCLEAAACGLPVVTTRVGNMPELIRHGENGFFVERDVEEIAATLTLLRDDPELRMRIGSAARTSVESWDWSLQAARYRTLIDSIVTPHRRLS